MKHTWIKTAGVLLAVAALTVNASPAKAAYYAISPVGFSFEDISGSGTRFLNGTDDATFSWGLSPSFNFYGTVYSTVHVSSNGLMSFTGPNSNFSNTSLTSAGSTLNLPTIAVLWDDWQFFQGGADAVYAQNFADRSVFQWNIAHGFSSSPSSVTFQAILFNDGTIRFNYADVISGDGRDNGASATIGVRNSDGDFTQWSFNDDSISSGSSLLVTPLTVVPAPAGAVLFAIGAAGLGGFRVLRRKKAVPTV
jgi:hypothetical protein